MFALLQRLDANKLNVRVFQRRMSRRTEQNKINDLMAANWNNFRVLLRRSENDVQRVKGILFATAYCDGLRITELEQIFQTPHWRLWIRLHFCIGFWYDVIAHFHSHSEQQQQQQNKRNSEIRHIFRIYSLSDSNSSQRSQKKKKWICIFHRERISDVTNIGINAEIWMAATFQFD